MFTSVEIYRLILDFVVIYDVMYEYNNGELNTNSVKLLNVSVHKSSVLHSTLFNIHYRSG